MQPSASPCASTAALAPPRAAALSPAIDPATASAAWRGGRRKSSAAVRLLVSVACRVLIALGGAGSNARVQRGRMRNFDVDESCASRPPLQRLVRPASRLEAPFS